MLAVSQEQGRVPVTVIHIQGDLDASNYEGVIAKAKEVHQGGARFLLLDLSKTTFISSSGIVALHSIAKMMRDEEMPDLEEGWGAIRAVEQDRDRGKQKFVKLFKPSAQVDQVLELVGFKAYFEIFDDLKQAVDSF